MKELIKIILNIFDFFTQQKILKALNKKFKNNNISILIDVGSHKGEYINSIKKKFKIQSIYGFEPNPDIFKILKKNTLDKNINIFNYGISDENGKINFYKNLETSSSSINKLNKDSKYYKKKYFLLNFFNFKEVETRIDIDVIRLDDFIKSQKIYIIDLIKIDTEGFEFKVLKSLGEKIQNVKIVHFEHHFDDMIIKNYKLTNIHKYLIKKGFIKFFKIKMKFRKSFEYLYVNKNL
ncbi:FkbM family methyltransferase [Candidatus Pelagibacter sp.]|nr:FkbM family methyltransferase [Candidatus Pelagibacter sp.]